MSTTTVTAQDHLMSAAADFQGCDCKRVCINLRNKEKKEESTSIKPCLLLGKE